MNLNLPTLDRGHVVAWDTETSGLHRDDGATISVVSISWRDSDLVIHSKAWAFDQGADTPLGTKTDLPKKYPGPGLFDQPTYNHTPAQYLTLIEWLSHHFLVGHNQKFDQLMVHAGLRNRPDTARNLLSAFGWDTQVVAALLDPLELAALKKIAMRLFGVDSAHEEKLVKSWLKKNCGKQGDYRYDLLPWDLVGPYAEADTELCLRLYHHQIEQLEEGLVPWHVVDREIDFAVVLTAVEQRGLGFNGSGMARASVALNRMIEKAGRELAEAVGSKVVPTEAYVRDWWFEGGRQLPGSLKLQPAKLTRQGKAAMTLDVVRDLADRGVPAARQYQRLNKLTTAQSMWYGSWPKMAGQDGRLRAVFHQTKTDSDRDDQVRGTISGRLAVQRIQLQAVPHSYQCPPEVEPVRAFLVADPGNCKGEVDLGQAEVRVAAHLSKCGSLLGAMNAGADPHSATAKLMFETDSSDPEWDFLRNVAKRCVFGSIYGAGAEVIAQQILQFTGRSVSVGQCEQWLLAFRTVYPEMFVESRRSQQMVHHHRYVELPGGRLRWYRWGEKTHSAWNQRVQGGVAEAMKAAMIDIQVEWSGLMTGQVHDSIHWESLEQDKSKAEELIVRHLVGTFETWYPSVSFTADAHG